MGGNHHSKGTDTLNVKVLALVSLLGTDLGEENDALAVRPDDVVHLRPDALPSQVFGSQTIL